MKTAIIGKKVGMTQIFDEAGKVVPVTVIEAGPCTVTGKMTTEKEGYEAVQLGYEDVAEKKLTKPEKGHLTRRRRLQEASQRVPSRGLRLCQCGRCHQGRHLQGRRQGRHHRHQQGPRYAGVIKRFGQGRTPTSHGGGPVHRHAGSMGSSTDPSRIFPGKKQAGHMGVDQVTVQNLDVVKVDPELNMIVVRGAIPGPKGGIVYIKSTVKKTVVKKGDAGISTNPQKASGRNPQKASARK